jgi:hypothetical protein
MMTARRALSTSQQQRQQQEQQQEQQQPIKISTNSSSSITSSTSQNSNNNHNHNRSCTMAPTLGRRGAGGASHHHHYHQQHHPNKMISSLMCKVIALLTLFMVLYIGVVVQIAVHHYNHNSNSSSSSSSINNNRNSNSNSNSNNQHSSKARWNQIKDQKEKNNANELSLRNTEEEQRKGTNQRKVNPFRLHNLDAPLTHGVEPEVLLSQEGSSKEQRYTSHMAMKDDDIIAKNMALHPTPDHILTAYLEPIDQSEWDMQPLPNRSTATQSQLTMKQYPRLRTCSQLIQQFPVDDTPCQMDSFLPWIHDVFPTHDGQFIQFIAQNRRRCKNGSFEKDILQQQQPQAALFQHISIKQIQIEESDKDGDNNNKREPRFRLATHEEADPDSIATRFICRFQPDHSVTTSVFNFDYDWTSYRKRYKNAFDKDDAGIKAIHTSQLIFKCPVPVHLQELIRTGTTVQKDYAIWKS